MLRAILDSPKPCLVGRELVRTPFQTAFKTDQQTAGVTPLHAAGAEGFVGLNTVPRNRTARHLASGGRAQKLLGVWLNTLAVGDAAANINVQA